MIFKTEEKYIMSSVHGEVRRITMFRQDKTDTQLNRAFQRMIKKVKNIVGIGFMGSYAYVDTKDANK